MVPADTPPPRRNAFGQPVGEPLPRWTAPPVPPSAPLRGRTCRLEPLDLSRHQDALFAAAQRDRAEGDWTYLAAGPFDDASQFAAFLHGLIERPDWLPFAIMTGTPPIALGLANYLRIDVANGSIEVGGLWYSDALKRTTAATEAMYLLMHQAFTLGYRRYEWKCDALNAPSRAAAERLGFRYEGTFRQAQVTRGRNRDTAWYSIVDGEWPAVQRGLATWLAADNFDSAGRQKLSLGVIRAGGGAAGSESAAG